MGETMPAMSLNERLVAEILSSGPMRFDAFMEAALFDADLGYYASGKAKIGRAGDFFTSVSVGALYGRLLAFQIHEVFQRLACTGDFTIIEQGGNDGRLACDILDALRSDHPAVYQQIRYLLVEPFEHLKSAQRHRLAGHGSTVRWASDLASCEAIDGVHFSNEYVDALPIRLFVKSGGVWLDRHVACESGGLVFVDIPTDEAVDLPDAPDGYLAEVRPLADEWLRDVCRCLRRGAVIVADYGFPRELLYAPWRTGGTLSCYANHRRDDAPLESPGSKDITSHVDFTALVTVAESEGFQTLGFADQCHFLTGIFQSMSKSASEADDILSARERQAFLTLTHPEMMGTQFKFLTISRGISVETALSGYRYSTGTLSPQPPVLSALGAVDR
jgi:SAM-dependent MidA family methyltransferase